MPDFVLAGDFDFTAATAFEAIADREPLALLDNPSPEDYRAHRSWAVETYGIDAWKAYLTQGDDDINEE